MSRPLDRTEAELDACRLWLSVPIDGISIEQEINSNDEDGERTIEWPLLEVRRIFSGKEWLRQIRGNNLDSIFKYLRSSEIGLDRMSDEEKRIDFSRSESTNGEFQSRRDEIYLKDLRSFGCRDRSLLVFLRCSVLLIDGFVHLLTNLLHFFWRVPNGFEKNSLMSLETFLSPHVDELHLRVRNGSISIDTQKTLSKKWKNIPRRTRRRKIDRWSLSRSLCWRIESKSSSMFDIELHRFPSERRRQCSRTDRTHWTESFRHAVRCLTRWSDLRSNQSNLSTSLFCSSIHLGHLSNSFAAAGSGNRRLCRGLCQETSSKRWSINSIFFFIFL